VLRQHRRWRGSGLGVTQAEERSDRIFHLPTTVTSNNTTSTTVVVVVVVVVVEEVDVVVHHY
jgi:hypothetical protein